MKKKRVLFVCIENSCRSQMAEAFARRLAPDVIDASSAGSHPSGEINPKAIQSMRALGYDLNQQRSKSLGEIPRTKFDYVITMGCGDECPFIPAVHHEDWDIPDPKDMPLDEFRKIRNRIRERVEALASSIRRNCE
ncbi:MAG: protein tyrosine phosphatase [Chloroflexi bacterium GWB2_49_20]|nr:MAG: protein tyrosine phosphatase [Chloroflexi bacterium GWB2_49_20]OGN78799.1 MAG: protein tyrosine phosphatase [Chloroflexi bacterium GWC2_49_37]OGN85896.1 MAG: protein tyrosine phosphatase [Chloroflexi bacterium GWD2_49_16]